MDVKNKLVVYTALFGNYDDLIDPKEKYEGCDFICFTDQKHLKSDIWEIRIVDNIDLPLNMMNRRYKILPHLFLNKHNYSLYIDSNIKIIKNPLPLMGKYLEKKSFVMPQHFKNSCLYDEATNCMVFGKSPIVKTLLQIKLYHKENFPKNFGLSENGILLRKHNEDKIIKIMNEWWEELITKTQRDQLSLGYILWKNKITFSFMKETARDNIYFSINKHNNEKSSGLLKNVKTKIIYISRRFFLNFITRYFVAL